MPKADTKNLYRREKIWWFNKHFKKKRVRFSLETESLEEAQARRDRIIADMKAGQWNEHRERTLNEAVDRWVDEHLPTLKPSAAERYRVSLVHLIEHFDQTPIHAIRSARLNDFEQMRRSHGVTGTTIRRDLGCLSSLVSSCEMWEWVEVNPVKAYMRNRARNGLSEAEPRTRYLSHTEEAAVLQKAPQKAAKAIAFAIDTGLRKEEQFSLLKSDIDLANRCIVVRREVTKTTRSRRVPLTERAQRLAEELLQGSRGPYLFTTQSGKRYSPTSPTNYEALQKGVKRAGITEHVRWHDLRRTCGCRLLQDYGYAMHEVSAWLGHTSIKVTEQRYAFLDEDRLGDKIRRQESQKRPQWRPPKAVND